MPSSAGTRDPPLPVTSSSRGGTRRRHKRPNNCQLSNAAPCTLKRKESAKVAAFAAGAARAGSERGEDDTQDVPSELKCSLCAELMPVESTHIMLATCSICGT